MIKATSIQRRWFYIFASSVFALALVITLLASIETVNASKPIIQSANCQVGITLTQNLIANAGAEDSQGVTNTEIFLPPDCWTTSGNFTTIMYGTNGFPLSNTIPGGGVNFFGGGPNTGESSAVQSLDISSLADIVDSGLLNATLEGFLGGYANTNDNMTVVAEFQSSTYQELGKITIGPVIASERDSATQLLLRKASSLIPKYTRHIVTTMTASREEGTYNDGYADNLSLKLDTCYRPIRIGENLLINGDAEEDLGATNDISTNSPSCWESTPNFTSLQYGAEVLETGPDPFPAPGSVPNGGLNLFAGGIDTEISTATQTIYLSDLAAEIDNGALSANLSAFIGGFSDHRDRITITATFQSSNDESLGFIKIGPVTVEDRNYETKLLQESATSVVPIATRKIVVDVVSVRQDYRYNDGYADNISLILNRNPIILLPGIMGSRLYRTPDLSPECFPNPGGEIWLDIVKLFASGFERLTLQDDGRNPKHQCDDINSSAEYSNTSGIIATDPIYGDDIYNQFVQTMRDVGYSVYIFPYDWRLDLNTSADRLFEYINSNFSGTKVILVGHSMGGLLARTYVLDPARAQKIDKVISVGTPYWGAPKIARNIRSGETPLYHNVRFEGVWEMLRNSPGGMQILPSEAWFDQSAPYYWNDLQELRTYRETSDFFANGGVNGNRQNGLLIDNATTFHSGDQNHPDYDDFSDNVYVPHYFALYASHMPTFGSVREHSCWYGTCWDWFGFLPGDGTAPSRSARLSGKLGDWSGLATTCEYQSPHVTKDHAKLMSDTKVIADILRILRGWDPYWCNMTGVTRQEGAEQESSPFLLLSAWGDAGLSARDPLGRITGVTSDGWLLNEIPLASIDAGQGGSFIALPITSTYTVTLEQYSVTPIQLEVTDYHASIDDEEFNPYERAVFVEIPSAISGTASMALDYSAGLDSMQIKVDLNNDGTPDKIITPTAVLDQQGIQDMIPPTTTITVDGLQDPWGFYSGAITATLTATDTPEGNATGVHKTEYSLDGGETWLEYSEPLNIIAEDAPVFLARSVDKGGNQEYPFAEKRLRPYTVFLPALQR